MTTTGRPGRVAAAQKAKPADAVLTPRGARTKAALVDAARKVFERDGFLHARITDIAEAAGVAHGTFYTYFEDKESIFRAVVDTLGSDFLGDAPQERDAAEDTPYDRIYRANRRYYDAYAEHGKMMQVLEEVATYNDELRAIRRDARRRFVERAAHSIRRWQEEGLADRSLDPLYAASALGSMVDRSVYVWIVLQEPHEPDRAVETLSRLWVNALGLTAEMPRKRGTPGSRPPATRARRAAAKP